MNGTAMRRRMKHARSTLWLAWLAVALAGCATTTQFDPAAEQARLLQRDRAWAEVASAGRDVDAITAYWSDDAVVIPPGQPEIRGRAALRAYVAGSLKIPGFRIHWVSSDVHFSPDGRLAYMSGTNEVTVPGADGRPTTHRGRAITVWRRDADGLWRCVLDIWNEPPAAPAHSG